MNQEEAEAILACAKDSQFPERDYAVMKLFLQTGCRLSELVKLDISQINLKERYVRHTCFTLLLKAGVDIATIKEIAGHDDINTTSFYLHVTQNEVRAAMEKHLPGFCGKLGVGWTY